MENIILIIIMKARRRKIERSENQAQAQNNDSVL